MDAYMKSALHYHTIVDSRSLCRLYITITYYFIDFPLRIRHMVASILIFVTDGMYVMSTWHARIENSLWPMAPLILLYGTVNVTL